MPCPMPLGAKLECRSGAPQPRRDIRETGVNEHIALAEDSDTPPPLWRVHLEPCGSSRRLPLRIPGRGAEFVRKAFGMLVRSFPLSA